MEAFNSRQFRAYPSLPSENDELNAVFIRKIITKELRTKVGDVRRTFFEELWKFDMKAAPLEVFYSIQLSLSLRLSFLNQFLLLQINMRPQNRSSPADVGRTLMYSSLQCAVHLVSG